MKEIKRHIDINNEENNEEDEYEEALETILLSSINSRSVIPVSFIMSNEDSEDDEEY
jgi:hypothetical protein